MESYLNTKLGEITKNLQTHIFSSTDFNLHVDRLATASAVLEALSVGVAVTDKKGVLTYVNAKGEEVLERNQQELIGMQAVSVRFFGPGLHLARKAKAKLLQNGHWDGQLNVYTPSGNQKTIQYYASVLKNGQGEVAHMIASMVDISEYFYYPDGVRQQRNLQEQQLFSAAALDSTEDAVWFVDIHSRLQSYNSAFAEGMRRELNVQVQEGINVAACLPPSYSKLWDQFHAYAFQGKQMTIEEPLVINSRKVHYRVRIQPVKDAEGQIISVCFAAQRLGQDNNKGTLGMSQQLQMSYKKGVQDERRRIGMELHDGVGQLITALQMKLNVLLARQTTDIDQLELIRKELASIQEEIRRTSHDMLPLPLERYGIEEALMLLLDELEEETSVKVKFYANFGRKKYPENIEKTLYRVVQELVQNTAKHTQADHIFLDIDEESDVLKVIYRNNANFVLPERPTNSTGRGLMNIRERVTQLGGTLKIKKNSNLGFYIYITLPL